MTSIRQNNHNTTPTSESFDVNLQQIEQTNQLLQNLEQKLSRLFTQSPLSCGGFSSDRDLIHSKSLQKFSREDSTLLKEPQNLISSVEIRKQIPSINLNKSPTRDNKYINIIEHSSPRNTKHHQNYISPPSSKKTAKALRNPYDLPFSNKENVNINTRAGQKDNTTHPKSDENHYVSRKEAEPIKKAIDIQDTAALKRVMKDSTNEFSLKNSVNTENVVEKMAKIEGFFKEKIEILEERLSVSEEEARRKDRQNEDLQLDCERLRRKIDEYEKSELQYKEDGVKREQRQQELEKQARELENELHEIKKGYKEANREKEELERRYEGLLKVQREMIQLDMERNETSLRNSVRQENANNEKTSREEEKMIAMISKLEKYKAEVEYLKENSSLMKKQYIYEISQLQEQLNAQRKEYRSLLEGIRGQRTVRKSGDLKYEVLDDMRKKRGEIQSMSGKDLADYVKGWRDFYMGDDKSSLGIGGQRGSLPLNSKMSGTYEGGTRNEGADTILNSVLDVDISNIEKKKAL